MLEIKTYINEIVKNELKIYNLGTGKGYSVLEMIQAFERASGKKVAYKIVDRRPGDLGSVYADCSLAGKELGWRAEKDLDDMCKRIRKIYLINS